jgi:chemotaxis protein methyltransferase CheR
MSGPGDEYDIEKLEIELLLTGIERRYGYDFRNYAPASLTRRLRHAMRSEHLATMSALQEHVLHDEAAMQRLLYHLSVHVTAMFRDPQFYLVFRRQVVPLLRTYPFVRIWHAGCSTGEEVYSLAILLHEEDLYERSRIYATDMSDELLHRARRGIVPLAVLRRYTRNYQLAGGTSDFSSYYTADHENAILREHLRRNIVFSHHNLASDHSFNEFNVIMCRNVLIYFDRTLRERVHGLLYDSLTRFGILGLGMKESMRFAPLGDRYEELPGNVHLYRRIR